MWHNVQKEGFPEIGRSYLIVTDKSLTTISTLREVKDGLWNGFYKVMYWMETPRIGDINND